MRLKKLDKKNNESLINITLFITQRIKRQGKTFRKKLGKMLTIFTDKKNN